MKCGGTGDVKAADESIKKLCEEAKEQILQKSGKHDSFGHYEVMTYKSQVVAGTNYFVKIKVTAEGECIHVRLFEPLPFNNESVSVHSVQDNKTVADAVEYF